ncbi:hypothetical protein ABZP36_014244 [Zizania latifolia]
MESDAAGAVRKRKRRGEGKPRAAAKGRARPKGKAQAQAVVADGPAAAVVKVTDDAVEAEEDYVEGITEESIAEVMTWLELEIKLASPAVPPAASPAFAPLPPLPASAASGGYGQAAKGNNMEGSCGASFSGSSSTVMASVDLRAGAPSPPTVPWPLPLTAAVDDDDEEAVDDAWVDQLLTDGPALEGQLSGH